MKIFSHVFFWLSLLFLCIPKTLAIWRWDIYTVFQNNMTYEFKTCNMRLYRGDESFSAKVCRLDYGESFPNEKIFEHWTAIYRRHCDREDCQEWWEKAIFEGKSITRLQENDFTPSDLKKIHSRDFEDEYFAVVFYIFFLIAYVIWWLFSPFGLLIIGWIVYMLFFLNKKKQKSTDLRVNDNTLEKE